MAKVPFDDVKPPERRSIRNIPLPNSSKRKAPLIIRPEKERIEVEEEEERIEKPTRKSYFNPKREEVVEEDYTQEEKPKKRKIIFIALIILVIAGFVVGMMTVFASATVEITPKSQDIQVSLNILGVSEAGSTSTDAVKYEIVKISKEKTASLPAVGKEQVELKAHGKIMIYNNFSTEPQRLIIRTRFENPQGLVFRIPESITVPGKVVKNGVETPGSIEVEVFADEAGEKYNIKKTDFTIPGFKSEPDRYKGFYARSTTDMTGGFVGEMKTVATEAKTAAFTNIDTQMKSELEKELQSKVPEGLVLLPGAIIYESSELNQKEDSSGVLVGKTGTAYAIMLNKADLSKKINQEYMAGLPEWSQIESSVNDFSGLNMNKKPEKVGSGGNIDLSLDGKVQVMANIPATTISEKLAGAPRGNTQGIIDQFPGISSIRVVIRPMWKQSFPDQPAKIHVTTTNVSNP